MFILIGSNFRPPKEVFRNVKGDVNVNVKCYVKMLKCSDIYCSHSSASGRKGEPLQKMDKKRLNVYMKVLDNAPQITGFIEYNLKEVCGNEYISLDEVRYSVALLF